MNVSSGQIFLKKKKKEYRKKDTLMGVDVELACWDT